MLYPIFVNLKGKQVLIVGGGKIATRKLKGLIATEAALSVISPTITEEMRELIMSYSIEWHERAYRKGDLTEAHLIIAATNDRWVNRLILSEAKDWQWVNIADAAEQGNVQLPAHVSRGKLTLAISTEGASPELAKKIKKDLSGQYGASYESYLDFLYNCRERIKNVTLNETEKRLILRRLLDTDFQDEARQQAVLGDFP
ncbi:MAG TPA: NAD(P)-binding protein, partial [Sporolactobacillaceae bacterium]|nr:NAD(P)-binding protein [Sporolactobacillaceae bacterium]